MDSQASSTAGEGFWRHIDGGEVLGNRVPLMTEWSRLRDIELRSGEYDDVSRRYSDIGCFLSSRRILVRVVMLSSTFITNEMMAICFHLELFLAAATPCPG